MSVEAKKYMYDVSNHTIGLHEFRNVIEIGLQHWVNKAYAFALFDADNIFWKMVQVGP